MKNRIAKAIPNKFLVKRTGNNTHHTTLSFTEDYSKAKNVFVDNKSKFYRFTLPTDKTTSLILRGLENIYSPEEIRDDLYAQGIKNMKGMKRFLTTRAKTKNRQSNLR